MYGSIPYPALTQPIAWTTHLGCSDGRRRPFDSGHESILGLGAETDLVSRSRGNDTDGGGHRHSPIPADSQVDVEVEVEEGCPSCGIHAHR